LGGRTFPGAGRALTDDEAYGTGDDGSSAVGGGAPPWDGCSTNQSTEARAPAHDILLRPLAGGGARPSDDSPVHRGGSACSGPLHPTCSAGPSSAFFLTLVTRLGALPPVAGMITRNGGRRRSGTASHAPRTAYPSLPARGRLRRWPSSGAAGLPRAAQPSKHAGILVRSRATGWPPADRPSLG